MKKTLSLTVSLVMIFLSVSLLNVVMADNQQTYRTGDIIVYGSYPQSEVVDEELIAQLNELLPEWEDWTSYGYYTGKGNYGTMAPDDFMRYMDVSYQGEKYRAVKFTKYRPPTTNAEYSSMYIYQYENGYDPGNIYWFRFDDLDWRVLDPETGLVMCESVIDAQPYNNIVHCDYSASGETYIYFSDEEFTMYPNNYERSFIRQWLNESFYGTAFTDAEKDGINLTLLNNDSVVTSTRDYIESDEFDSDDTEDKIFLLSYNEVRNPDYGFESHSNYYDEARQAKGTDCAGCQGLKIERYSVSYYNPYWFLRTAGPSSGYAMYVNVYGDSSTPMALVHSTYLGIRPAMVLDDISSAVRSDREPTNVTTTAPSTTQAPVTTLPAETTTEPSTTSPTTTTQVVTEPTTTEPSVTEPETTQAEDTQEQECSCNCHQGGFKGFIYKFLRFFWRLFKTNQFCSCGEAHY